MQPDTTNQANPVNTATVPVVITDTLSFDAEGKFTCVECKNTAKIQVTSEDGLVDADLAKAMADLVANPEKISFGVCPVCGMEYQFMLKTKDVEKTEKNPEGKETTLVVKPSDEEK